MDDAEYGLIVSFPDPSESFVHGFEAGMIWARMEARERKFSATVHDENCDVLRRMATASGYEMSATYTVVDGWIDAEFELTPRTPLRVIRGGLAKEG